MTAETPRRCHRVHCLCDVAEGEGRSVSALERVSASARCRILMSFFLYNVQGPLLCRCQDVSDFVFVGVEDAGYSRKCFIRKRAKLDIPLRRKGSMEKGRS